MEAERWVLIEQICQAALDRAPNERAKYLDEACAGDEELRREVASLLAFESGAKSFIEEPPGDLAAELLAGKQFQPGTSELTDFNETAFAPALTGAKHNQQPKPFFFWLMCAISVVLLGYFVFAGVMTYRYGGLGNDHGWQAARKSSNWYVTEVNPQGAAAGKLQVGDQLLAINDDPRFARIGLAGFQKAYPQGGAYTVRIARGSVEHQFDLQTVFRSDSQQLLLGISYLPLAAVFFLVGAVIGLFKPGERTSQLGSLALLIISILFLRRSLSEIAPFLSGIERLIWLPVLLLRWFRASVAYHFCYRFPAGVSSGWFWSFLIYLFYVWTAVLLCFEVWAEFMSWSGGQSLIVFQYDYMRLISFFSTLGIIFSLAQPLAICAVTVRNYRLLTETDHRRRVKWIIYCTLVATLATSAAILGTELFSASLTPQTKTFVLFLGNQVAILNPIAIGYAILKHRVFDINVVVRRGLQYLLARNSLRLLLALPLLALTYSIIANPDRTVREILFQNPFALALIAAAALSLAYQQRFRVWLDRRFFREAYDQEQLLIGLIEEVKELGSMSEIARAVSQKVEAALHPKLLYVFYREEHKRDLHLGYSSGEHELELNISESSRLLRLMEGHKSAVEYAFLIRAGLPASEQTNLSALEIELLVPMNGSDGRLVGLLMLGEKKSEQPYTATDRRLLYALAQQVADVYEIGWLKGRVDKGEQLKRDVLSRLEGQQVNLLKECPACGACYDVTAQVCAKDGSELTMTLPVERQIDGKYRLDRLLGRGGMGAVYEATDERLQRQVAVKIITGRLFGDKMALRRFEREAQASARLNHPNVIAVHDYGTIGADGAYLVMELLRGITLRAELKQAGTLAPTIAAAYFDQLLEGLKAAHQAGIIHRDLKPENILLTPQKHGGAMVKILDFGLAKLQLFDVTAAESITAPGMVMGTFGYMSPEQLTGGVVDERSDIFAVGVMVVEAITGNRPFRGKTHAELLAAILNKPFHLAENTPATQRLDAVLQKCLAKEAQQRYGTASDLQAELISSLAQYPASHTPDGLSKDKSADCLTT